MIGHSAGLQSAFTVKQCKSKAKQWLLIISAWILHSVFLCCSLLPQINMMLANLYRKAGQERSAVTSYKEVLRQCPVALDAIIGKCVSDGLLDTHKFCL